MDIICLWTCSLLDGPGLRHAEHLRPLAPGRELHEELPVVEQLVGGRRLRLDQEAVAGVLEMEVGLVLLLDMAAV
eukprot:Skav202262  [mRNA]  locus=scaffold1417:414818:415042:- [translate_table: standard]